jgi:uridine phosphorylase
VTVLGYRARDGSLSASGGSVTLPDGSELNVTSTGIGAPSAE